MPPFLLAFFLLVAAPQCPDPTQDVPKGLARLAEEGIPFIQLDTAYVKGFLESQGSQNVNAVAFYLIEGSDGMFVLVGMTAEGCVEDLVVISGLLAKKLKGTTS